MKHCYISFKIGNTKVWSNAGNNENATGSQGLKTRGVAGDNSETPLIRGDRDWTLSFWMKTTANNSRQKSSQARATTSISHSVRQSKKEDAVHSKARNH